MRLTEAVALLVLLVPATERLALQAIYIAILELFFELMYKDGIVIFTPVSDGGSLLVRPINRSLAEYVWLNDASTAVGSFMLHWVDVGLTLVLIQR